MPTTVKEIIRRLEADGWSLVATKGSHRQFTHKTKTGRVTVPGKLSADFATGHIEEHPAAGGPEGLTPCVTRS